VWKEDMEAVVGEACPAVTNKYIRRMILLSQI
jgi:hypothetical protein